ncbi:unnamed protein product [Taenia asiatica]|uniref:Secreted protein n=1 Tax=Taenia asiatica TaxID=60517 RepID=A0A0R3VXQ5_TAEAS|nr:unnamed protein product [Taenia asiatica]
MNRLFSPWCVWTWRCLASDVFFEGQRSGPLPGAVWRFINEPLLHLRRTLHELNVHKNDHCSGELGMTTVGIVTDRRTTSGVTQREVALIGGVNYLGPLSDVEGAYWKPVCLRCVTVDGAPHFTSRHRTLAARCTDTHHPPIIYRLGDRAEDKMSAATMEVMGEACVLSPFCAFYSARMVLECQSKVKDVLSAPRLRQLWCNRLWEAGFHSPATELFSSRLVSSRLVSARRVDECKAHPPRWLH